MYFVRIRDDFLIANRFRCNRIVLGLKVSSREEILEEGRTIIRRDN